jgi:hypothetical protein
VKGNQLCKSKSSQYESDIPSHTKIKAIAKGFSIQIHVNSRLNHTLALVGSRSVRNFCWVFSQHQPSANSLHSLTFGHSALPLWLGYNQPILKSRPYYFWKQSTLEVFTSRRTYYKRCAKFMRLPTPTPATRSGTQDQNSLSTSNANKGSFMFYSHQLWFPYESHVAP